MAKIHLLPDELINQIAAGEVIERPASVVKELVENAIDAGAARITIEIQGTGKKLIRVADNGRGMSEKEISLALQRHSTSKISSLDDLFNIQTLGFRGEALPSIASVSKTKISPNPSGAGLTVEVKELFHNIPVRKKFLKSDATEMGHIGDIVAKYILAYPGISFELTSDGKPLLQSAGTGNLKDAIMSVYGVELLKELSAVAAELPWGKINGLVSRPTITRLDKNYEIFFVNGRSVKNFLLNRALEEAYRTLIPSGRYPVGVIFISIDPKLVDVNVHPTKREVKFLRTNEVTAALTEAVKRVWDNGKDAGMDVGSQSLVENDSLDQIPISGFHTGFLTHNPTTSFSQLETGEPSPVFQVNNTYIIKPTDEGITIIDQHAAHERILYDQLSRPRSNVQGRQPLLVPEAIEVGVKESAILKEDPEYFHDLGFELEEFGQNTYLIRTVPAAAVKAPIKQLLLDLISELGEAGKAVQLEVKLENARKLIACHSAIRAGDKLTVEEMNRLVKDLYNTASPATCPHGRPTIVKIDEPTLKKWFQR